METKTSKIIRNFINEKDRLTVLEFVDSIRYENTITNSHISYLSKKLNGHSYVYDISKSPLTSYIAGFQSGNSLVNQDLPPIFDTIINNIAKTLNFPKDHVFLQVVDMDSGGSIKPHYDISVNGYVNFKCNLSILSEDYAFSVDKEVIEISESDLYCFEASLYKHWTIGEFTRRRVLLSFGFVLPYTLLGRTEFDPRVRLSQRIEKYFQK